MSDSRVAADGSPSGRAWIGNSSLLHRMSSREGKLEEKKLLTFGCIVSNYDEEA